MSHSASEIDSGAIRRVNYTLVIARCERARARDGLSVRKMTMYSGARECVVVVTYTVKRFRFAPWDNLRRSLPSASPVVSLYFSLPLSLSFFSLFISLFLSLLQLFPMHARAYGCSYTRRRLVPPVRTRTEIRIAKHCSRTVLGATMSSLTVRYSPRTETRGEGVLAWTYFCICVVLIKISNIVNILYSKKYKKLLI